jgi:hypothetical protein
MLGLRVAVLAHDAVAVGRAPAADHHGAIFVFAHAGHAAGHLLEAQPMGRPQLGQEIDVAAERDGAVQIHIQHRLLLRLGHRPLVQIGVLISLETLAVVGLHERHTELVQVVTLAALFGVEDRGPGYIQIRFVE